MNDSLLSRVPDWTPSMARRVDQVCDRFESAWRTAAESGNRPRLEDYLEATPEPGRSILLRELLAVELDYRRRAGEDPSIEDFRSRFSAHSVVVDEVFSVEAGAPTPHGDDCAGSTKVLEVQSAFDEDALPPKEPGAPVSNPGFPVVPNYDILEQLGGGGMGVVYKAHQHGLNRVVALKMVRPGILTDGVALARFQGEAEAIARLQHPNIVQVYEIGAVGDEPFFSLEYVDGGTLADKLKQTPPTPREAAELLETLALAMEAVHQHGIVHGDLKPLNVLLHRDGRPKITDFGLAKRLDATRHTQPDQIMGTPHYMAPEQASGRPEAVGPATDVYALGVILYEAVTGHPPFRGTFTALLAQVRDDDPVPPRKSHPEVPHDLETICLKCLQKEPRKRYASARGLAEDLRHFLNGEPIQARPVGRLERGIKWARRHPTATVAVLVLGVAVAGYGLTLHRELAEYRRTGSVHAQASRAISEAQGKFKPGKCDDAQLADAQLDAERGLALLSTAPSPELEAQAHALVDELRQELEQRQKQTSGRKFYEKFKHFHTLAMRHNSHPAGLSIRDDVFQTREAARNALALFGPDTATLLQGPGLSDEQKQEVQSSRYELMLVRADALAHVLPGEDPHTQARLALAVLREVEPLRPPTQAYYLQQAQCLALLHDERAAQQARDRGNDPRVGADSAVDQFLLGNRAYQEQDWPRALDRFEEALRRQPNHFWAQYLMAICNIKLQHYAAAKANLSACRAQQPRLVSIYLLLGLVNSELGEQARQRGPAAQKLADARFQAAEGDFRTGLELKPDADEHYVLLVNRAALRIRRKMWSEAERDAHKAIELNKEPFLAYVALAKAYHEWGRLGAAIAALDEAVKRQPNLALLYRERSRLYQEQAEWDAALRDLDTAIRLQPPPDRERLPAEKRDLADDHLERANLLYRMRRLDEAVRACDDALKVQPESGKPHQLRAGVFLEQKRYRDAVAAWDAYLAAKEPATAGIFEARALAKVKLRDYAGAIQDYTQGLALEPTLPLMHAHRGWAYLLGGDSPKLALCDFEKALELKPGYPDGHAGRGLAHVRLGDYSKAVEDARTVIKAASGEPRMLYNAARIYALAVPRVEADLMVKERQRRALAEQYEVQALTLLRRALELMPASERATAWKDDVQKDPALDPIRRRYGFRQLEWEYGGKAGR